MIAPALLLVASLVQTPVVLTITYADGRIARHVITAKPTNAWTPLFPRSADWRSPEGLPVTAINYQHVAESNGVRVRISLFLGTPHQKEIAVANVLVTPDHPMRVTGLEPFGVEPVSLALGAFEPRLLPPPRVENKTAALHIESVEMSADARPGYHIQVRNYSAKPVMTFAVETFRGDRPALSGRRGERDGSPVVPPGGTYTFFLGTENPLDVLTISGLMFEDGSVEGDAAGVAPTRLIYLGRRVQLDEVVRIYGEAAKTPVAEPAAAIATLAARVEALSVLTDPRTRSFGVSLLPPNGPVMSSQALDGAISAAMLDVRKGVLSDLENAPRDRDGFTRWLQQITAQYFASYQRFIELTR